MIMSAFDPHQNGGGLGLPPTSQQDYQTYDAMSGQSISDDFSNANSFGQVTTSFDAMNFLQTASQAPNVQQSIEGTVGNQYYFQDHIGPSYENSTIQSNMFLQQPSNYGNSSNSASMAHSMSPSTLHDHVSPGGFGSDQGTSMGPYESSQLEAAIGNTQFRSPLLDDGQDSSSPFGPVDYTRGNAWDSNMAADSSTHSHIQTPEQQYGQSPGQGLSSQQTLGLQLPPHGLSGTGDSYIGTPTNGSSSDVSAPAMRLLSPIVRIEYTDDADLDFTPEQLPRRTSGQSGGKRSRGHLSPYPDESSDDGEASFFSNPLFTPSSQHRQITPVNRQEDGSWAAEDESGQPGIGPEDRHLINQAPIPTIDELEDRRLRSERNAEVEEWLSHSEAASDEGETEDRAQKNRRKKVSSRPRAKSANDAAAAARAIHAGVAYFQGPHLQPAPGPGVLINEPSDMDEDDFADDDEDDYSGSESDAPDSPALDPTQIGNLDPRAAVDPRIPVTGRYWDDADTFPQAAPSEMTSQPYSSNAAIMRFGQRAKEMDNASLAATIGSRRRSESDIGSLFGSPGVSRQVTTAEARQKQKDSSSRLPNILTNMLPGRSPSKKRKSNPNTPQPSPLMTINSGSSPAPAPPRRIGSFGRSRTPRLDTNVAAAGNEARSPGSVAAVASATIARARSAIRSRSKSDLGKLPKSLGLADLLTQHGGLPVPTLASPAHPFGANLNQMPRDGEDDSDNEELGEHDGFVMDLAVRSDMVVIPTHDGFSWQIAALNPHMTEFLRDRLVQEQLKRYRRLVDLKTTHEKNIVAQHCGSGKFCPSLGGQPEILPPKSTGKGSDNAPVVFKIITPGMSEKDVEMSSDGQTIPAQFPLGVPLPPVQSLPARFECPYCFKVKDFKKPSDWTKHVHEDVQPFTCTFPNCNEPKSFKRKADWVRHENERHRQLESWTCNIGECTHTCYRRDNFVQHLCREHKVPEPRVRTGRQKGNQSPGEPIDGGQVSAQYIFPNGEESVEEYVQGLVRNCRQDSTKQPSDEPCRFCGNICSSFKKLTVHLAKHMEQVSMPVIKLVDQLRSSADDMPFSTHATSLFPTMSLRPNELSAASYFDEPAEMDPLSISTGVSSMQSHHQATYPPHNLTVGLENQLMPPQAGPQQPTAGFDASFPNFVGQSYPPLMVPSRSRAASFNEQQQGVGLSVPLSRQGTTFPPPTRPEDLANFGQGPFYC
jgi:hypothetical protein